MPQAITTTQLQNLQQSVQSGGADAAAQAYGSLYAQGYNYAGWAQGVATGDSTSGQAALSYLQGTALMGMGGDQCRNLGQQQIDKIRTDMANQTLEKYKEIAERNNGTLDRDLTYQETKDIHEKVFADNGLSLDNWTLNTPMELIRQKYGDQAVEKLWEQMRDTGGDGADAAIINSILLTFMEGARNSQNPDVRQKAESWLNQFDDFSEWWDIITNTWSQNFRDFYKDIKDWFDRAKNWRWPRDPIILDLDGDGLETVGLNANIYFDHDGDGVLTKTGWVGKDDALLVWDRNGNGSIDTGAELFGDFTPLPNGTLAPNGFAALAALDSNGDGVIDANDPVFAQLRVWVDADTNARTGEGELLTLEEARVKSINLAYTNSNFVDAQGNAHRQVGSYTTTDGQTRAATDVWFTSDVTYSLPTEWMEVPEDIAALPDAQGYGKVRDLRQAMAANDRRWSLIA